MAARDPRTGQFVSAESVGDIEVVSFRATAGVPAADLAGGTGFDGEADEFEGLLIVDYDEVVDRNEELILLSAHHTLSVFSNSTQTADGTVLATAEVSASPARTAVSDTDTVSTTEITGDVEGQADIDDTIDLVGRPLTATGHAPFSDGATGVGGGGSAGEDRVEVYNPPAEMARFHPRDELFVNGQFRSWNIADAGVHLHLVGQHVYEVRTS